MRFLPAWLAIAALLPGGLHAADEHPPVPSFNDDVIPVLTRFGCNMGACHGKLAGQKGFKLSLRGYAPEQDYESITREGRGRRIVPGAPEQSLLIRKAVGAVPHGGGARFAEDSPAAKVLIDWIRAGMPGPKSDEPALVAVDITPKLQQAKVDDKTQMKVVAKYADGRERDVTWLTQFATTDAGMLDVSPDGEVHATRNGEAVVQGAFRGFIEIASFTVPYDRAVDPQQYAARNNDVDEHVFDKLAALKIEPSSLCDEATFLRRVYLDLIGLPPTPEEVRAFLADTRSDKRAAVIDQLLERPEYVDYWSHWLGDLLQNRKERDHDVRGTKGVRDFNAWLRNQVAANRHWNDIARDVLTAKGTTKENPAVGYFIVTVGEQEAEKSEVGDSVAQAFLGTRIGCARCHNHPLEKYTQDDYYHFVAFFSRVALDRKRPEEAPTELIVGTRHYLNQRRELVDKQKKLADLQAKDGDPKQIEEAQKQVANTEKQIKEHLESMPKVGQPRTGKQLEPRPLDRQVVEIPPASDPREVFVKWMIDPQNEYFSGAMVNRLWKHFLGVGLVEPVDDLRATNPPTNKPLWDLLNKEFVASNYDLKHVMRLILKSRTYQLSSATREGNFRDAKFYSHFYARRLPAEVLLDAICQATQLPEQFNGYPRGIRATQVADPFTDSYFLTLFGRSPRTTACACEQQNDVTLPQLLHLQNGDGLHEKLKSGDGRLAKLIAANAENGPVIDELFLATFGRTPTSAELEQLAAVVQNGDRKEVLLDLFWALMNAKEFTFSH